MSEKTHIEWASHTASPWFGCSKVSPGCTNCYAEQLTLQKKWAGWGDNSPRVKSKGFWKDAYRYDRNAKACQEFMEGQDRPRMFTSLMDWLDPMVPIEWLAEFLNVIFDCQYLDWLLLTKRPELWKERMSSAAKYAKPPGVAFKNYLLMVEWLSGIPPSNVWFGVTCENQAMADHRIPLCVDVPAKIHWLSVEPLLETVDLKLTHQQEPNRLGQVNTTHQINWVVVGGESGANRRDCGTVAIKNVVKQCMDVMVPVFVKQDCAYKPGQQGRIPNDIWALKQYPQCP